MLRQLEEVYYPETLLDAVRKKQQYGSAAAPIAGGTDLVPEPPAGIKCLIDITRLGLDYVHESETEIRIGATTTMQSLATSIPVAALAQGLLSTSTCEGWPRQIRNAATIGGNLASGGPFADTPPALLALDAQAVVVENGAEKVIEMGDFFVDYRRTAIGDGILKEVRIPKTSTHTRGVFLKLCRTSVDKAMVNVAVLLEVEDGRCRRARVALGAVTRIPCRVTELEKVLCDEPLDADLIERAARMVVDLVDPVIDFRASADYRREMSGVLVRRALTRLSQAS